jgi:hypothetical protein
VNTLDDALALQGIARESYVQIRGYHEAGDGGGGLFRVTGSAAETDGGTVFAFDEDVSSQKSYTSPASGNGLGGDDFVGNTDLVWGTVTVQYGDTEADSVGTEFLHGHTKVESPVEPLNLKDGLPTGTHRFWQLRQWYNNDPDGPYTVRYKHATSDRRLERIGITNAVSIDWWGAKEADPQNPVNNWWRINYAINKAADLYQNGSYDWAYVDIPGEYYYRYSVRLREGVKLRGASDRYDEVPTRTFGEAANGKQTYGKLTIMPGMAMNHTKDGWIDTHVHHPLRVASIDLSQEYMASKFGAETLEFDGNIDENLDPIENPDGIYNEVQSKLQNGNNWNAFAARGSGAWELPDDAEAAFNEVYFHDFPGNGIAGNSGLDYSPSSNVRIDNAPRNHQIYRISGHADGWTLEGSGWASNLKTTKGTFTDLTLDLSPNTLNQYWGTTWYKVFDHHGKGFGVEWDNHDQSSSVGEISVDGFTVDVTDEPRSNVSVFADRGYGGTYKNGTIESTPTKGTILVDPVSTNGNGPIRDYTYKNITVTDNGGGVKLLGSDAITDVTIDNLTIQAGDGVSSTGRAWMKVGIYGKGAYEEMNGSTIAAYPGKAARLDFTSIDQQVPKNNQMILPVGEGNMPHDLFLLDSSVSSIESGWAAHGILLEADNHPINVFLNNTTFEVWDPVAAYKSPDTHVYLLSRDPSPLRLRNCQTPSGLVSDEMGTYTSDASDEGNDYVLISAGLLSLAQEKTATVTSGNRSVTSVENADANGNILTFDEENPKAFDPRDQYLKVNLDSAIQSGNTITLDWTARVTPLEDYQTTGVFTTRPLSDQSYASGTGPFTIDLRGVAASQESKVPITYTASSSNTSVATVNVNSYEDPDGNQIPWELELIEEGTGTATITVTGSIDGVGTTTDTFEISVE